MRPVLVVWVDSMILDEGGWLDVDTIDDAMTPDGMRHESVGYLVRETADALALAGSRNASPGDIVNEDTRAGGVTIIPKVAILRGPVDLTERRRHR